MKKNNKILVSLMISLVSFSLASCNEPDTDSKPPDITTGIVTEKKPVTITTVSTVTKVAVTSASESDNTNAGYNQAQYEYDKLGRVVKVIYDDLNYIEYEYDANGNIKKVIKTEKGIKVTDTTNS